MLLVGSDFTTATKENFVFGSIGLPYQYPGVQFENVNQSCTFGCKWKQTKTRLPHSAKVTTQTSSWRSAGWSPKRLIKLMTTPNPFKNNRKHAAAKRPGVYARSLLFVRHDYRGGLPRDFDRALGSAHDHPHAEAVLSHCSGLQCLAPGIEKRVVCAGLGRKGRCVLIFQKKH